MWAHTLFSLYAFDWNGILIKHYLAILFACKFKISFFFLKFDILLIHSWVMAWIVYMLNEQWKKNRLISSNVTSYIFQTYLIESVIVEWWNDVQKRICKRFFPFIVTWKNKICFANRFNSQRTVDDCNRILLIIYSLALYTHNKRLNSISKA